jgi:hypothetical protein
VLRHICLAIRFSWIHSRLQMRRLPFMSRTARWRLCFQTPDALRITFTVNARRLSACSYKTTIWSYKSSDQNTMAVRALFPPGLFGSGCADMYHMSALVPSSGPGCRASILHLSVLLPSRELERLAQQQRSVSTHRCVSGASASQKIASRRRASRTSSSSACGSLSSLSSALA